MTARKLAFAVEPFTLDKSAGAETRTAGRNIVVSLGAGDEHSSSARTMTRCA